jgi:hypothetical protein
MWNLPTRCLRRWLRPHFLRLRYRWLLPCLRPLSLRKIIEEDPVLEGPSLVAQLSLTATLPPPPISVTIEKASVLEAQASSTAATLNLPPVSAEPTIKMPPASLAGTLPPPPLSVEDMIDKAPALLVATVPPPPAFAEGIIETPLAANLPPALVSVEDIIETPPIVDKSVSLASSAVDQVLVSTLPPTPVDQVPRSSSLEDASLPPADDGRAALPSSAQCELDALVGAHTAPLKSYDQLYEEKLSTDKDLRKNEEMMSCCSRTRSCSSRTRRCGAS